MGKRDLLTGEAIEVLLTELEGWELVEGVKLKKTFVFGSFGEAMGWMVQVALAAEVLDHHPNWSNVYKRVTVELWTHSAGGVTALDRLLALKMDGFARRG